MLAVGSPMLIHRLALAFVLASAALSGACDPQGGATPPDSSSGTGTAEIVQTGSLLSQHAADRIEIDSNYIYFSSVSDNRIHRMTKAGVETPNYFAPSHIANLAGIDDHAIYWTGTYAVTPSLFRASKTNPDSSIRPLYSSSTLSSRRIVTDSAFVYFVTDGDWQTPAKALRAAKSDGHVETLATLDFSAMRDMAIDTHFVYVATGQHIMKFPKPGGVTTTLVTGSNIDSLVVSHGRLYWTDPSLHSETGRVLRAPLSGHPITILASDQDEPGALAVDAAHVYWSNATLDDEQELESVGLTELKRKFVVFPRVLHSER